MNRRSVLFFLGVSLFFFALGVGFQSKRGEQKQIRFTALTHLKSLTARDVNAIEVQSDSNTPEARVVLSEHAVIAFMDSLDDISISKPNHPAYSGREIVFYEFANKNGFFK